MSCLNFVHLEQRAKVIRTADHVFWLMFTGDIGDISTGDDVDSELEGGFFDPNYDLTISDFKGEYSKTCEKPIGRENVLLIAKTLTESFSIHSGHPREAILGRNLWWAPYYDEDSGTFKPITNVYYQDIWRDPDAGWLDVTFWSNVYKDDLDDTSITTATIYDGLSGPQESDIYDSARSDGIVRCLFYTKGEYRTITVKSGSGGSSGSLKAGLTEEKGSVTVGMFLFSRPILILYPGQENSNTDFGDPVARKVPYVTSGFVELR